MRILVTGSGGFVGRHLLPRLVSAGHEIVRLRRGVPAAGASDWAVPAALRDIETAPGWPEGIEAVVHLAAANPARNEKGAANGRALAQANVEGTAALARRSAREGVKRFVFLSSANVHAVRRDAEPITERDPIEPQNAYALSKAEAEDALDAALGGTATRSCILRPAPVFGSGGRGTLAQLARLAATPLPVPLGGLGGRRSLVAVEDLVEAIVAALTAALPRNETLLVSGGAATPAEIVRALRGGRGAPPRILPAPGAPLRFLCSMMGKGKAFDALASDFVIDAARAERLLDWQPAHSLLDRLRQMGQTAVTSPPADRGGGPAARDGTEAGAGGR